MIRLYFIGLALLFSVSSVAQGLKKRPSIDTLFVSDNKVTNIIFPSSIIGLSIGNEDFGYENNDSYLKLKAIGPEALATNIFVQYGDDKFYNGTIVYKANPEHTFLNFKELLKDSTKLDLSTKKTPNDDKSLELQTATKRLNNFLSQTKVRYESIAFATAKVTLKLTDLMTDTDGYLYLKMYLANESKVDYQIDFVEFNYCDPTTKSTTGNDDCRPVYKLVDNGVEQIRSKITLSLGYVIPKWNLNKKGYLEVTIREKAGTRVLSFKIPFKEIVEATAYK